MYGVDSEATDQGANLSDFADWVAQQPPPEGYRATVSQIGIDGNCAMARLVEQDYYGIDYVIYFSLVRYQSDWQIVTKTYSEIK
jgi:Putative lumazine-binding